MKRFMKALSVENIDRVCVCTTYNGVRLMDKLGFVQDGNQIKKKLCRRGAQGTIRMFVRVYVHRKAIVNYTGRY